MGGVLRRRQHFSIVYFPEWQSPQHQIVGMPFLFVNIIRCRTRKDRWTLCSVPFPEFAKSAPGRVLSSSSQEPQKKKVHLCHSMPRGECSQQKYHPTGTQPIPPHTIRRSSCPSSSLYETCEPLTVNNVEPNFYCF